MEMVSVVVPIYNKEKYIKKCIDSLLKQSYENIEIILIDDGSTDKCKDICLSYSDKRIKYFYKKNGGVSSARNYGITKSTGEWILFVDADDYVENDYVEKLYNNDYDFTMCSFKTVIDKEIIIENSFSLSINDNQNILNELLKSKYIRLIPTPYLKIFNVKIIKNNNIQFDEKISYGEDTCFVLDYLKHCDNALIIDYNGYSNVISKEESLSRKYIKQIEDQLNEINIRIDEYEKVKETVKSIWYFRNFKTILYNEVNNGYDSFKKVLINSKKNVYFSKIKFNEFEFKDKLLYLFIKYNLLYLVYILYKRKR